MARSPASSQLALAQAIGHDRTRLIALLLPLRSAGTSLPNRAHLRVSGA